MRAILAGIPLVIYFVLIPMWANILGNIALTPELDARSKMVLFLHAQNLVPCDVKLLTVIGENALKNHYNDLAGYAYEKASKCSPSQGMFHFLFGEMILTTHKPITGTAISEIKRSLELEPNNPIFAEALLKATKPQLLSPAPSPLPKRHKSGHKGRA